MEQNVYDVIIIGAGAAGLMAAWELVQVNKKVLVLEAKDRAGGRILTLEEEGFTMPVELGAEFIHGKLKLTQWLLEKAGIESYKVEGSIWRKEENDLEEEADFIEDYSYLDKKFQELDHDMPVAEFLDTYLNEEKYAALKHSLKTYVEGYYAADTRKASTYAMQEEMQKADDEQFRVEGGYKQLINYLEQEIMQKGGTLQCSAPVQVVLWEAKKVTVQTAKGDFFGQKLLVTVPLGVLQADSISFHPAIMDKMAAAKKLGFGPAMKVILEFKEAFWHKTKDGERLKDLEFIFSDEVVPTWWSQYPKEAPILIGWLGGPHAERVKNDSEEVLLQKALTSLSNIFSLPLEQVNGYLKKWKISNWAVDAYCLGGYSFEVVDGQEQKRTLKEPVKGTLFFAGEALHEGIEVGTVEAGLVNGREMAHQLIASF